MPLRLEIKRKFSARSDRVKSLDLHPTEPWVLASLYNGNVHIWNYENQGSGSGKSVKSFEFSDLPVRAAKFIARKHWVVAGCDDMTLRVFNYNTSEKVHAFEAHSDYIRSLAVHPTQPYVLSSSDDMLIKLWDWEKGWQCNQVFEGHTHYVMMVAFNPKDTNTFASASLDRTVKVWQLGSPVPNFTLEGHEKGVNCVDYFQGGEKPYLVTGADDRFVKIWDYQNKTCVQTLEGHTQNVSIVCFHPELPIIISGSEDGTVRLWHASTYRLENTLNYGLERIWAVAFLRGSNAVAFGYDEGTVIIKLGREEPALSMDAHGKIIWARHNEIQQANLKTLGASGEAELKDGERLPLAVKELGSCEVYPQTLAHSSNGRFVVVCGDGEYIIYTALAWRNKSFGSALEFVWAADNNEYATRESSSKIKVFGKNFKERTTLKPDFSVEGIYGGALLGVRSSTSLAFYDWESAELVRRIEISPKGVFWSDAGDLVSIVTDESFFILKYHRDVAAAAMASGEPVPEDGVDDAFEVVGEVKEVVKTGCWVGDCFLFTNTANRLCYHVGGEIVTVSHLDRPLYLLGYIAASNRVFLSDKDLNVVSFKILVSVLEYQTAVLRQDFATADRVLPQIPLEDRNRVAHFLERQGFKEQALAVSTDSEHRFDLAVALGKLPLALEMAEDLSQDMKWRQLAELAMASGRLDVTERCLREARDYAGLLLLYSSSGSHGSVRNLAQETMAAGNVNIAFVCFFLLAEIDMCVEVLVAGDRLPEAAFFAKTYAPSRVSDVVSLWKEDLQSVSAKAAQSLADPTDYANLFPNMDLALAAEERFRKVYSGGNLPPAHRFADACAAYGRDIIEEMRHLSLNGNGDVSAAVGAVEVPAATTAASDEPAMEAGEEEGEAMDEPEAVANGNGAMAGGEVHAPGAAAAAGGNADDSLLLDLGGAPPAAAAAAPVAVEDAGALDSGDDLLGGEDLDLDLGNVGDISVSDADLLGDDLLGDDDDLLS